MQTYAEIHAAHTGKVSDKWTGYFPIYDRVYRDIREAPVTMLEIGVQNGGSLEVLTKYFPNAKKIVGCDINPKCGTLRYESPKVSVIVGDINTPEVFARIANEVAPIDALLDDGSHRSIDILSAFVSYFPLITPGGLYVIEDTSTLYAEGWGGGVLNTRSAQFFFRLLTDVVNYEHWERDVKLPDYLSGFFPKSAVPAFILEGWVESIEFLNAMIVIRKAKQGTHAKIGRRMLAGTESTVATFTIGGVPFTGAKPAG